MLNSYPGPKLKNLRQRALLTQMQVVELTGISETTIAYLERGTRKPQTQTLEKLLNLYAVRIARLEKMERLWGADGLQKTEKGETTCPPKYPSQNNLAEQKPSMRSSQP